MTFSRDDDDQDFLDDDESDQDSWLRGWRTSQNNPDNVWKKIDGEFATVFLKGAHYTGVFDGRFTSKKSTQQASRATEPRNSSSYRTMHRKPSISCHARFVPFRAADLLACHDALSCPEIPRKLWKPSNR
jgi:hypothetical protein